MNMFLMRGKTLCVRMGCLEICFRFRSVSLVEELRFFSATVV